MTGYRGGEIKTEVVVDRNLWTEIVDRTRQQQQFFIYPQILIYIFIFSF